MEAYDTIVLGLGGMGSAALFHLACRGKRVLGIERFNIPHDMGSSHGITRIIRLAYYENPAYVPLLRRSFELWRELETISHERLLVATGSIDASEEGNAVFKGSRASCELHQISHEILDSRKLSRRFPGYRLPASFMAVYQPDGGFLLSERCIVSHVMAALSRGGGSRAREGFVMGSQRRWRRSSHRSRRLPFRETNHRRGRWSAELIPELARAAVPERQVLGWFQPRRRNGLSRTNSPFLIYLLTKGALWFPGPWHPRFQDWAIPSSRAGRGPGRDGPHSKSAG